MSRPCGRRVSFAVLRELSGCENLHVLADRVGTTHAAVRQLVRRDLSLRMADRYACALGLHPLNVWPDYYDEAVA